MIFIAVAFYLPVPRDHVITPQFPMNTSDLSIHLELLCSQYSKAGIRGHASLACTPSAVLKRDVTNP